MNYRSIDRQWEAFALWRFSPKVQLRLTVQDLLAQDNITVSRFTDAAGFVTERSSVDPRYRRLVFDELGIQAVRRGAF